MEFLNDNAKRQLKQVLMLKDETGHMPSFAEFNEDPRTDPANNLAHNFGSYSRAIERAVYYDTHRSELKVERPSPSMSSPRVKHSPVQPPTAKPPEPQNRPQTAQTANTPILTPKTAPEAISEPLVPEKENATMSQVKTIKNFTGKKLVFLSKEDFFSSKPKDTSQAIASDGVAINLSASLLQDNIARESSSGTVFEVPIYTHYCRPALLLNGAIHDFPDPKDNVLVVVDREIALAARELGRETDDLIFPDDFTTTDSEIICYKLGRL